MRIVILSLFSLLLIKAPALAQTPSKKEMQAQMLEAVNEIKKQIGELEKQIETAKTEDPESVKDLQEQVTVLKKNLAMMQGVNKSLGGMSERIVQQAAEEDALLVPKKDVTRINSLPKRTLTDAELFLFLKNAHTEVEKLIPAAEKSEALNIYNETKQEYNSLDVVANAASGCWMIGHWEKALFIMGKVCIEDISNADNLNNYAAFLIMAGAEHAALPILEYLNGMFPGNSTILTNLGQAWFGLGEMNNAKKYLGNSTESSANATLSKIYQAEGNTAKAITFLKASIKRTYDPDKEAELLKLGVRLTYSDLPELNYPMEDDPFNVIPIIESLPENYPSQVEDAQNTNAINRYKNGIGSLRKTLTDQNTILDEKLRERAVRLSTPGEYQQDFLQLHNSPAYKLATRSVQLLLEESISGFSSIPTQLLLPGLGPFGNREDIIIAGALLRECEQLWQKTVVEPIAMLSFAQTGENPGCAQIDAVTNAYIAKKKAITQYGTSLIKQKILANRKKLARWFKLRLYSKLDNRNINAATNNFTKYLDERLHLSRLENEELDGFLAFADRIVIRQQLTKSACNTVSLVDSDPGEDDLVYLIDPNYKCKFTKTVSTPLVAYSFECNTVKEVSKSKLTPKKDRVNKGKAHSQKRRQNPSGSPGSGRGPSAFLFESDEYEIADEKTGPVNAEDKDLSQFSIEYDRWGNLIGLDIQVNEEGAELADPDSKETPMNSRWSWVAEGNIQKRALNKLAIKPTMPVVRSPKTNVVPGTEEPIAINRQLPKTDNVKQARNDFDYSKIDICTVIDDGVIPPPRSPQSLPEPLPKIKPNGELDHTSSRKDALSLVTNWMWNPGDAITVGMDLTSAKVADKIKQYAKVWETVANIHFEFVPDISKAQVKIGFDPEKGNFVSKLGRKFAYDLTGKNNMNLGSLKDWTSEEDFRWHILHEFGHVLGFIHEHQSPAAGIPWNTEVLYRYFELTQGWSREQVDANIISKYTDTETNSSVYDKLSIMHYYYRPELTLNGESFTENKDLSMMDKAFAGVVYPFPQQPSDVSGALQATTFNDCDVVLFSVDYDAVNPNVVEFILEPGLDHNGNRITWWKKIGIPTKGGPEIEMEIVDGSTATKAIPDGIIDKDENKGISFWKVKTLGFRKKLGYWRVLPAIPGGTRVRLTWQRDSCN